METEENDGVIVDTIEVDEPSQVHAADVTETGDGPAATQNEPDPNKSTDSSLIDPQLTEQVKRGRGRPRKSDTPKKLNDVQSSDIESRTDFMLVTPSLKRGRGRPPNPFKPPKPEVKRPPGRPRIHPPKMPSDRGPGRPRIHPKVETKKRFARPMNMSKSLQIRLVKCTVRDSKKRGRPPGSKNKKKEGKVSGKDIIKRPRGRPPKTEGTGSSSQMSMSYIDFVRQVNEELSAINGTSIEDDLEESTAEDRIDSDSDIDNENTLEMSSSSKTLSSKRGRGRPPGAKNKTPEEKALAQLKKGNRGRGRPKLEKRGPGRPPKYLETTPKESQPQKKRGRPPKSSSHTELDSSTDESRSRHCKGDVSYTEAVDEVIEVISDTDSDDHVDVEEEEVVKRGRGRPPNSTKRKRGRPPLSETKKVKKSLSPVGVSPRKRGRPPKDATLSTGRRPRCKVDYAAMAEGSDIEAELEDDQSDDSTEAETTVKVSVVRTNSDQRRGRGRPRKYQRSEDEGNESFISEDDAFTKVKEKRGRGRPRKLVQSSDFSSENDESQFDDVTSDTESKRHVGRPRIHEKTEDLPKERKGPGRPKKYLTNKGLWQSNKNNNSSDSQSDYENLQSDNAMYSEGSTIKRGPGRPKKIVDSTTDLDESFTDVDKISKPKKGPGRPPKAKPTLEMTCDEEESDEDDTGLGNITMEGWEGFSTIIPKKGRGRPKKTIDKPDLQSESVPTKESLNKESDDMKKPVQVSSFIDDVVIVKQNDDKSEDNNIQNKSVEEALSKSESSSSNNEEESESRPNNVPVNIAAKPVLPMVTVISTPVFNMLPATNMPLMSVISTPIMLNSNVPSVSTNALPNMVINSNLTSPSVNPTPILLTNSNMTLGPIHNMPNIVTVSTMPPVMTNSMPNIFTVPGMPQFMPNSMPNVVTIPTMPQMAPNSMPNLVTVSRMPQLMTNSIPNMGAVSGIPQLVTTSLQNIAQVSNMPQITLSSKINMSTDSNNQISPVSFGASNQALSVNNSVQNEVTVSKPAISSSAKSMVTDSAVPQTKVITETIPQNSEPGQVSSLFLDTSVS